MIYFDNAATTKNKPKEVLDAFIEYVTEIGVSPGRGSYTLGVDASRMLYKSRMAVADFFGICESNVVFTKNSTEAINLFFRGVLEPRAHVLISPYEHNAVLRPLEKMREEGIVDYSVIDNSDLELPDEALLDKYCNEHTKLIAITLASNVTGRIIFKESLFKAAHDRGIITFLDASQGAGKIRLNMCESCIDYLAFTGHKDLKGLPGVGGLCSINCLTFEPLIQGGTGVHGHEKTNPDIYPEGYEAGTLNMPAIWALKKAIEHITEHFSEYAEREANVTAYLIEQLSLLENVVVYDRDYHRVGTVGFNVKGYSSNEVVQILDKAGICTRGGIHCAILTHEALNTTDIGIVRVSLSNSNTTSEVDKLIDSLRGMEKK